MPTVRVRVPARSQQYEIRVGDDLLPTLGAEVRAAIGTEARIAALISDRTVFDLYGGVASESLRSAGLRVKHFLVAEGERNKSLRSLERTLNFLAESGLQRNDLVVALGGGVVGDIAGFAAAVYLRGIAFVQAPTTLLAQIDSSVGGKTGVNLTAGKNLAGAFHQPRLVVADVSTLRTLPRRELTAGFCEMIKQGAVGDRKLFERTARLLKSMGADLTTPRRNSPSPPNVAATVAAHCRFKASIVAGDEREDAARTDVRSRRILNFGHTTAHALEKVTRYRRFRHGEAVGLGMLVAGELSKSLGMLAPRELELLREAVAASGQLPRADDLSIEEIIRAMAGDKKSVAGRIKWVLLERIGRPRIVGSSEIPTRLLRNALRAGLAADKISA
jgi:3-dehydroquinate synthase